MSIIFIFFILAAFPPSRFANPPFGEKVFQPPRFASHFLMQSLDSFHRISIAAPFAALAA
jgi:hypothetical protein